MDATRIMTTAALSAAMVSLFAPPLAGLMYGPPPPPAPRLEIALVDGQQVAALAPGDVSSCRGGEASCRWAAGR